MKPVLARIAATLAAVGLTAVLSAAAAAASPAAQPRHRLLATTQIGNVKVVVSAVRGAPNGGAPLATVNALGYHETPAGWKLIRRMRIGASDGWFWFPVRVCSMTFTPQGPAASRDTLTLSLLVTPSIGCAPAKTVRW